MLFGSARGRRAILDLQDSVPTNKRATAAKQERAPRRGSAGARSAPRKRPAGAAKSAGEAQPQQPEAASAQSSAFDELYAQEGADASAEGQAERHHDKLGRALSELFENPLVSGAIGRALGARERAAQAQELWMGALNLPSAADIERLTRRVRAVSQRLEGVEDGVSRIGHSFVQASGLERRLISLEERLGAIEERLGAIDDHLASCEGPLRALRSELEGLRGGARSSRSGNP